MGRFDFPAIITCEISSAIAPLTKLNTPEKIKQFFHELGFNIPDIEVKLQLEVFGILSNKIEEFINESEKENYIRSAEILQELLELASRAFNQIKTISEDIQKAFEPYQAFINNSGILENLPKRITDYLVFKYLEQKNRALTEWLLLVGIVQRGKQDKTLYRSEAQIITIHWDKLPQLFADPINLLKDSYAWAKDELSINEFIQEKYPEILENLVGLLNSWAIPAGMYPYQSLEEDIKEIRIPMLILGEWPETYQELGLVIRILKDPLTKLPIGGLQIQAYTFGGIAFEAVPTFDLGKWKLNLLFKISANAKGQLILFLKPDEGLRFLLEGEQEGNAMMGLEMSRTDKQADAYIFGNPRMSRLSYSDLGVSVMAKADTKNNYEAEILFFIKGGKLVLTTKGLDGFLTKIISGEIKNEFDFAIGWSNKKGVFFESSGGLELKLNKKVNLGFLELLDTKIVINPKTGDKAGVTNEISTTLKSTLGPLKLIIENVGLKLDMSFSKEMDNNLGPLSLGFGLKPPTGLSLTLNTQGITGGGFLSFRPDLAEYKGGLVFEFQKLFTFRAIGIINTKLPGGEPGFSLFIMITGQFPPVQLSFGFTLSGLGGLFGYNRTIDTDVLNQMVLSGRAANLLFPPDDTDLMQIVNDAGQAFPVKAGNFVFGPMAKIGWGTPTIITAEIGLAIEVPDPVRVAMLGVIRVTLPEPEAPVARLNMVFLGVLDFSRKLFTLQATLFDSQLLSFALTGDFAMYISWGQQPLFIFSAGGFHPAYKETPPQLNALRRLSLTLIDTQELKIGVQTYLALTSNTVQIGARAQVWGKTAIAEFNGLLWFDVLFQLDPFQFQAEAQLIAGVKIFGQDIAAVHLTAVLTGPGPWHFRGHGYVHILGGKHEIRRELAWGGQAPTLAPPSVDVWEMLKQEVAKKENWQSTPLPDSSLSGVSVKDLSQEEGIVLLPNVQLTFKQKLVPFGVELQKFGNAIPQQRYFEIQSVRLGKVSLATQEMIRVDELFAPASFLQLSDAEKLSRPSFENMQGGVAIRAASASGEVRGTPTECPVEYELKYIRAKEIIPQKAAVPLSPAEMLQEARAGSSFRSPLSREQTRPSYAAVASVMPRQEGFVLVQGRELSPFSENGQPLLFTSQTEAYQKRQKLGREDLLVMSTLEMEN